MPQAGVRARTGLLRTAEAHAAGTRRRDALALPLLDVLAFHLRHVAEQLQHDVGDKRAGHVAFALARVEQRHVEHHHGRAAHLHDAAPFFLDFLVVAAEAVDGFHYQHVAGRQRAGELAPRGAFEVFAAGLVGEDAIGRHAELSQRVKLARQVLVAGADARIAI